MEAFAEPIMTRIDLLTLEQIRAADPCADGWAKLIKGLGYTTGKPDLTRVVSLGDIATTNDAEDALWATRCLPHTLEARRFRVSLLLPMLRRSLVHATDERVRGAVDNLERWVAGDDSVDLSEAARAARAAWAAWAARAAEAAAEAAGAAARAAWAAAEAAGAAWAAARAAWAVAEATWAARAAEAAAEAAGAAGAAEAAAEAAGAAEAAEAAAEAAGAAGAVAEAERAAQVRDIITLSPLYALKTQQEETITNVCV